MFVQTEEAKQYEKFCNTKLLEIDTCLGGKKTRWP